MSTDSGGQTAPTSASTNNPAANPLSSVSAILGDQLNRLIRTKWSDPNMLAQELYSMFSAVNQNVGQATPVAFNAPGNPETPSQTFQGFTPEQPIMTITPTQGPTIEFTPSGFTANGVPIEGMQFPTVVRNGPSVPQPQQQQQQGGGGTAGWVMDQGSEDPISASFSVLDQETERELGDSSSVSQAYQVQLVTGQVVTAYCGQLADGDTIPGGTFVLLAKVNNQYYFQVPVWM